MFNQLYHQFQKQIRMKNFLFSAATLIFLLSNLIPSNAQITATWKGNKPGQATEWNCAANWVEGRVPNEFSQVVIPAGAAFYPVIKDGVEPVDALLIESGATLTLQQGGRLTILNETGCFGGVSVLGTIKNNGILEIINQRDRIFAFAHK